MIKWKRSDDGYATSHCGQWKISPLYFGCVNPQWYELHHDGTKIGSMFETQRDAKTEADRRTVIEAL